MTSETRGLVLGVDGGGSKSLALLAATDGRVLGRGVAGPSNYQGIGAEPALAALELAIAGAFADAEAPRTMPSAICVGLAGVDRPEDRELLRRWAAEQMPGVPLAIVNDAELVLAAGTPDGWGAALICGTGSIAYGRQPDGTTTRAGGWGYLLGDEGSGYAISRAALQAVMRAYDGRAPETALTQSILTHWALPGPTSLVGRVYRPPLAPSDVAALATLVLAAADAGDIVAAGLLREAGRELALAVQAVVRGLNLVGAVPCALAGSLIVKGQTLQTCFRQAAVALGLVLDPVMGVDEPAQGAIRLAQRLLDRV